MIRRIVPFVLLLGVVVVNACSSDSSTATLTVNTSLKATARAARDCTRITCAGSPESFTLKLYGVWVSPNTDCTAAVQVADHGSAGTDILIGTNPLIQTSPANGTYKCMILKMSDNLRFVPDSVAVAAHTHCAAGTTSTFDIFRTDNGGETWKNMDGTTVTGTGTDGAPGDDTVFIFASTVPSAVQSGSIGAHVNQTITLTSELVVPGQTTFFVDFSNGVADNGTVCKIEGGTGMGFRS